MCLAPAVKWGLLESVGRLRAAISVWNRWLPLMVTITEWLVAGHDLHGSTEGRVPLRSLGMIFVLIIVVDRPIRSESSVDTKDILMRRFIFAVL